MSGAPQLIESMDATALRETCARLRHEITQIAHWRRLVRARLDLTVARAVLPDRLGSAAEAGLLEGRRPAPTVSHNVLVGIAQGTGTAMSVADLPRLRSAEDALCDYESAVRRALMITTDALVARLGDEAASALVDLPAAP